jgi:hypothetical protein
MMDSKQTPPTWLRTAYRATGDTLSTAVVAGVEGKTVVWEATFPAGRIKIPNGGLSQNYSNYFVVVRPLDSSWIVTKVEDGSGVEYVDGLSTYPNPFNPQVSIAVQCGQSGSQGNYLPNVRIFNMQGRLVAKLVPQMVKLAGKSARYEYSWNAWNYASGAYLVSVATKGKSWKKTIMLLK